MRLWEDTALRVEGSARGKPPELPNLPKRISVDDLVETWFVRTVQRAWRKLTRPAEPTTVVDCPNAKKEEADDTEEIRQEDDTKEENGREKSPFQADDGKEQAEKSKSSFQKVSR